MPCGKKPLVRKWDKPRNIRCVKPSRYEKNEDSVKIHWKKIMKDMELFYKDDQFWESQCDTVRELVGPVIFARIAKIFDLPLEDKVYEPQSDSASLVPSENYHIKKKVDEEGQSKICIEPRMTYSLSEYAPSNGEEEEVAEEQSEQWSLSSVHSSTKSGMKSMSKRLSMSKSLQSRPSKSFASKSFAKFSKTVIRTLSSKRAFKSETESTDESASSSDDLNVFYSKLGKRVPRQLNPHFDMLYCHESETDMIKWKSKYKVKVFEVSASDEFSKKAEILSKQISKDFYEWWVSLGNVEFKSEIKRPEDIEGLFQVWFDEHASRGLMLHPKILPCVLSSIADAVGVPKSSCPNVLKRHIESDILGESTPAHIMAFGTSLPEKMKHIPPKNNTEAIWNCVKIPEDLNTMACVWEDVNHLTSTKAFQAWLEQRPHLPMPECLKPDKAAGDKKQPFVVPSDYVVKDRSDTSSIQDLALPVSQFSLELKEVLSKLMNQ